MHALLLTMPCFRFTHLHLGNPPEQTEVRERELLKEIAIHFLCLSIHICPVCCMQYLVIESYRYTTQGLLKNNVSMNSLKKNNAAQSSYMIYKKCAQELALYHYFFLFLFCFIRFLEKDN